MSPTSSPNPNLQDAEDQLSLTEDSQVWTQSRPTPEPLPVPPELAIGEMLEEPKMVFPVARSATDASALQRGRQQQYRQGRWSRLPIRNKVITLAVLLGVLPTFGLGLINYSTQNTNLAQGLEKEALNAAEAMNDQLALFMRERFGDIQVMAKADIFADAKLRETATPAEQTEALDRFLLAYPIYESIGIFDLQGNVMTQSRGKPLGNQRNEGYFQEALAKDGPVIGQPVVAKSTGLATISVAAPLKDESTGKTLGIVTARIAGNELDKMLAGTAQGKSSDGRGNISYHIYSGENQPFADSLDNADQGSTALDTPVGAPGEIASKLPFLREAIEDNQRGQKRTSTGLDDISGSLTTAELAAAYVPFGEWQDGFRSQLPPLAWTTVTTIDTEILAAKRWSLIQGLIVQALLTGGILAVVAGLLATRATRPLLKAVDAVKSIGEGKLDVRLPVKGEDELAILAANLNHMAEQLEGFTDEQQQAAKRSAWLNGIAIQVDNFDSTELHRYLTDILIQAQMFLGVDRTLLYRLNEAGQLTVAQESTHAELPRASHLDVSQIQLATSFVAAFERGEAMALESWSQADLPESYSLLLEQLEVESELLVPLVEDDQLTGLLVAQTCEQRRAWSDTDVRFLQQIAAQLAVVAQIQEVQAARGLAELQAQAEKERTEELQRRVLQLLMEVDPVSQGDLTIRAKVTEDEIGTVADSYNATIESLRRIVTQVQTAVAQVSTTASGSGEAIQVLSLGAEKQTLEIADALGSIEQMAQSIRQVADNAMQAEAAVQQAAETVKQGDAAMDQTVEGIFAIRETVGEAAKKVKRLGESSQKISKVVNLIGSFAEQTNLLALNASIEAAHAGEEGRGFAVVADEVRSLARQSAAATAEIEALVAEIQAETNQVSAAMESGTVQVVTGTQLVEAARQNLTQIAAVSDQISALVAAIAQATNDQTKASEDVSLVMGDVAAIANDTSASASQVSQSIEALMAVARSLETSVGQFKVQ